MKRYKTAFIAGILAASLFMLAGCETSDNEGKPRQTYDGGSGKSGEAKPESGKVSEEESGFASSDEAIVALWQGMADCSKEEVEACFLGEDVLTKKQYKLIQDFVDEMIEKAESLKEKIVFDIDNISVEKDSVDPEDLPSHITTITDVEKAYVSIVVVPMTQTAAGVDYNVIEKYEIYTIQVDGRWYVDTQINNLGAEVLGEAGGSTAGTGSSTVVTGGSTSATDEKEWCTVTRTTDSVKCVYTNGVSDAYEIVDGVTFDDLCDRFEKESSAFDRETFRRVVSLTCGDESTFAEMRNMDISYQVGALATYAELAARIDKVDGKVQEMELNASAPEVYVYKLQSKNYGDCELYLNSQTGYLKLVQTSTGSESEGIIAEADLTAWKTAALQVLTGK